MFNWLPENVEEVMQNSITLINGELFYMNMNAETAKHWDGSTASMSEQHAPQNSDGVNKTAVL
jgi:hypothetical protein